MGRQCYVCNKIDYLVPDATFHCIPADKQRRQIWLEALNLTDDSKLPRRALVCSSHFNENDFLLGKNGKRFLKKQAVPTLFPTLYVEVPDSSSIRGSESTSTVSLGKATLSTKRALLCNFSQEQSSVTPKKSDIDDGQQSFSPPLKQIKLEEHDPLDLQLSDFEVPSCSHYETHANMYEVDDMKSSSSTDTASETERELICLVNNPQSSKHLPEDAIGPKSKFRGILALGLQRPKRKRCYVGDLTSDDFDTPCKAKKNFGILKEKIGQQRRTINTLQATVRRLRKKITDLNSLLTLIRRKR